MRRLLATLAVIGIMLAYVPAFAQDAPAAPASSVAAPLPSLDADGGVATMAKWIWDHVVEGHWWPAAAALLIMAVWAMRKWGSKYLPWLATDKGGAMLALGTSMVGAVLNAYLAGKALDMKAAMTALGVGFAAGGGWTMVRKIMGWSNAAPAPAPTPPAPPPAA